MIPYDFLSMSALSNACGVICLGTFLWEEGGDIFYYIICKIFVKQTVDLDEMARYDEMNLKNKVIAFA